MRPPPCGRITVAINRLQPDTPLPRQSYLAAQRGRIQPRVRCFGNGHVEVASGAILRSLHGRLGEGEGKPRHATLRYARFNSPPRSRCQSALLARSPPGLTEVVVSSCAGLPLLPCDESVHFHMLVHEKADEQNRRRRALRRGLSRGGV